jgi:hypothetical protein
VTGRVDQWWTVGPYRIEEVVGHPFREITSGPMYRFAIDGKVSSEMFESMDRALVAAVGERHMGPRGASGNAVGTAADWFCVMIGLAETEAKVPAQPAVDSSLCPGRGRRWAMVKAGPGCPVCHKRPEDMGTADSDLLAGPTGWLGVIPDHQVG